MTQVQSSPTRLIFLTRGLWTLIDHLDYPALTARKWYALKAWRGNFYAGREASSGPHGFLLMHRVILNAPDGVSVDHINGDGLDNRRCNLRLATNSQNAWNRGPVPFTTSKYKGVTLDCWTNTWKAQIGAAGRRYHLGRFVDPVEAARAYDTAALRLHGEFARINFP